MVVTQNFTRLSTGWEVALSKRLLGNLVPIHVTLRWSGAQKSTHLNTCWEIA